MRPALLGFLGVSLLFSMTASALPARPIAKPTAKLGRPSNFFPRTSARPLGPGTKVATKLAAKPAAKPAIPSRKPMVALAGKPSPMRPAAGKVTQPSKPTAKLAPPVEAADHETPVPPADDPNRARILSLQEGLNAIVRGKVLGRLRVGMRVLDLATGQVLFSRRGSVLMDPASNQKVLATATALLRLGSTWRFRTELSGPMPDSEGTIAGDLVLHGTGDPSLRALHLEAMAQDLARRGVSRIEGRVLGDPRRIGSDEPVAPGRSPLRVGWSAIEVNVRPGNKVGASAIASLHPGSDAFRLVNQAVTVKGRGRVAVSLSRAGDHIQVVVTGKIGLGRHGMVIRRAPPSDTLYAAIMMRAALVQAGIEVHGLAGVWSDGRDRLTGTSSEPGLQLASTGPAGDTSPALMRGRAERELLAVHESAPLPLLIRRVNKNSDNEWAERVLEAAGAETYGGSANTAKGVRALREALSDLGVASSGYNPANGSGLGHQNRVTATTMADLLRKLYFDPRVGPDLLQSLSVGGVDGTTRNRFRGSSAAERVRAKTGTLNGVSCLSGYVGDKSDVLAFSIMVEGHRHRAVPSVRAAQVSAVNAMMRFARGGTGAPSIEEGLTGQDLETGGEAAEIEGETELPENASPGERPSPNGFVPPSNDL